MVYDYKLYLAIRTPRACPWEQSVKLSKMDAGTIIMKEERVFLQKLLEQSLESLWIPAELKGIAIEVQLEQGISYIGDLEWAKEALTNI